MYYGANCYLGTNYSYSSDCWVVYGFASAKERDEWVDAHPTHNCAIDRRTAYRILRVKKNHTIVKDHDGRLHRYP